MDLNEIKTKYERLKKNGVSRLLSLEKIIDLENKKELIINNYLKYISDLLYDNGLFFTNGIDEKTFLSVCSKYFGYINYNDTRFEKNTITRIFIFDLAQIVVNKKNNEITYSVTIYWDT